MHQLTGCSVNITEIQLSSSHGVSCDPAQKDMFSSYQCQTVQSPSISLSFSLSPCLLQAPRFQKRQKAKQTESRGKAVQWPVTLRHCQDTGDSFSHSLALSYIWQEHPSLQQMSWLNVPTTLPRCPLSLLHTSCWLAQPPWPLAKHGIEWWEEKVVIRWNGE